MNEYLILTYIMLIYIALAFAEGYTEGRYGWAKRSYGWRLKVFKRTLTAYHFWMWLVLFPMFLMLPLIIYGFDSKIFWLLLSSFFLGAVVNDIAWYIVNPKVSLKDLNPKFAKWYNWWNIFGFKIPDFYVFYPVIFLIIWIFLVR